MSPDPTPQLAPYIVAKDAPALAQFLERALGATIVRQEPSTGSPVHFELRLRDGIVMIGEAPSGRPPFPAMVHLYVPDADAAYARALRAGATSVREPARAPDGLTRGGVRDAWGNEWWFSGTSR